MSRSRRRNPDAIRPSRNHGRRLTATEQMEIRRRVAAGETHLAVATALGAERRRSNASSSGQPTSPCKYTQIPAGPEQANSRTQDRVGAGAPPGVGVAARRFETGG